MRSLANMEGVALLLGFSEKVGLMNFSKWTEGLIEYGYLKD